MVVTDLPKRVISCWIQVTSSNFTRKLVTDIPRSQTPIGNAHLSKSDSAAETTHRRTLACSSYKRNMTECQECYLLTFNLWPSQTLVDNHTYTVGKLTRPESDTQVPLLRPESWLDDTRTQFVRNQLSVLPTNFITIKLVLPMDCFWLIYRVYKH